MQESEDKNPTHRRLTIGSVIDRISLVGGYLSGVVIFVLMALVTVNVLCRRLLHAPLIFGEEYSAYLMVFCVYLGAAYTLRENAHIRVDVVTIRLKERMQIYLRAITSCLSIVFGAVLTWKTTELVFYYREIGQQAMSVLETPTWIPASIVPVGMVVLTLQMLLAAVQDVRRAVVGPS